MGDVMDDNFVKSVVYEVEGHPNLGVKSTNLYGLVFRDVDTVEIIKGTA